MAIVFIFDNFCDLERLDMLGRILRNAVRTGVGIGLDVFETLVERGETALYGDQRTSSSSQVKKTIQNTRKGTVSQDFQSEDTAVHQVQPHDGIRAPVQQEHNAITDLETTVEAAGTSKPEQAQAAKEVPQVHPSNAHRLKAPPVCMKTIRTRRTVCLDTLNKPAVLIFHGQANANEAAAVNFGVQKEWFPQTPVFVANIVPLRFVPAFLRRVAEDEMEKAYDKGIKRFLRGQFAGASPEEVIYIFPDWKNVTSDAFHLDDPWHEIEIIVLDQDGYVIGRYRGGDPAQKAIEILGNTGCL